MTRPTREHASALIAEALTIDPDEELTDAEREAEILIAPWIALAKSGVSRRRFRQRIAPLPENVQQALWVYWGFVRAGVIPRIAAPAPDQGARER